MNYPTTVIGTVRRLSAQFVDRRTGEIVTIGAATVRVANESGTIVVADEECAVGVLTYYDWDTAGMSEGKYYVQFEAVPVSGLSQIEPAKPALIVLVPRLGE